MSRHDDAGGSDAGTDEEFVDHSFEEHGPDGAPAKAAKTRGQVKAQGAARAPKGSRPQAETVARGKPRPDPVPSTPEPARDGAQPELPAGQSKSSSAEQPAGKQRNPAEARGPKDKPARPAKDAKQSTKPAPEAASTPKPSSEPVEAKPASAQPAGDRDPGGYPEFHAPTRARKDGKRAQTIVFLHGGNVANWSWDPQVRAFGDYEVLTPHLPGFGARAQEDWAGLDSAADDVAAVIADEVSNGGAHLVGLSLGGVIALRVLSRHPELVESLMISGVPAAGVSASMRTMSRMQLRLFGSEWYWRFQAGAYGMVADEKDLFAEHGTHLRADNMRAIMDEVDPGGVPAKLGDYKGPALVVAGGKEPKLVAKAFPALARALPQALFRMAPGMHHQWNIEDPLLFNATVRAWVEKGTAHPRLQEPAAQK
ncbi:alpha/beta fold hydrolase [Paeniglutamicibacter gangotriensis]|uniref:alpha/beta fold hydrolase n=1 Tax=Paeniglutamicibacter gangotriensis TaxID=254787 RepID=UPI0037CAD73D